jgi:ABC-2 type transport system ATP-binding protein
MSAIEFTNVVKRFGAATTPPRKLRVAGTPVVAALGDVSFTVNRGEMFGLIGPDGAGKTTAIRAMCGLLHVDSGTIRILGKDPVRQHRDLTSSVGYLSQRFSLYGDLSIDENIAFFAEIHGVRDYRQRRDRLLEMTQLSRFRDRLADQLSGGMKQKLALACTLVHEPEVILLDEPTTGVDPVSRREFWKLLSQFLASGITIVMSTPYLDEAERCGRIVLLHEGHVLALDEPGKLRTSIAGAWFEVMVAEPRRALDRLRARPEIAGAQVFGDRLHVRMDSSDPKAALEQLNAVTRSESIAATNIRQIVPSLEDVFISEVLTRNPS